jgi:hypothetical protein
MDDIFKIINRLSDSTWSMVEAELKALGFDDEEMEAAR